MKIRKPTKKALSTMIDILSKRYPTVNFGIDEIEDYIGIYHDCALLDRSKEFMRFAGELLSKTNGTDMVCISYSHDKAISFDKRNHNLMAEVDISDPHTYEAILLIVKMRIPHSKNISNIEVRTKDKITYTVIYKIWETKKVLFKKEKDIQVTKKFTFHISTFNTAYNLILDLSRKLKGG